MGADPLGVVAVCGYLAISGVLPLFNKALFQLFPFPVSATVLQIAVVALLLALLGKCRRGAAALGGSVWAKAKLLLLPSFFFAANITLTNLGVHLTDVNVHILLRASELPWVVGLGLLFANEPCPSRGVAASCVVLLLGVVLVSCGAGGEVAWLGVGPTPLPPPPPIRLPLPTFRHDIT